MAYRLPPLSNRMKSPHRRGQTATLIYNDDDTMPVSGDKAEQKNPERKITLMKNKNEKMFILKTNSN